METKIGIGLLGLGTVGTGVASIIQTSEGRNPLVSKVEIKRIAVRDKKKARDLDISPSILTLDPNEVIDDPSVQIVVEVIGGLEPARTFILRALSKGKSVVTANKAVIARHGKEIANAAREAGVYVLIEAAVGGGIPIIEPLKQSLGGNRINKVSGIINGTTNYILSRMDREGAAYQEVLTDAQKLGYAESDPAADVEGLDAADKISILSSLAFGGEIDRTKIPTEGINKLQSKDVNYAKKLGYGVKLLAISEQCKTTCGKNESIPLTVWVEPTLVPKDHPLSGVNGVNNGILVEGDPIGKVMFYGPGAGSGPTASAVVADILNIAGIKLMGNANTASRLDPLLSAEPWRSCHVADEKEITQKNYVRLITKDTPGVIGSIGTIFGKENISIESIVQFDSRDESAEIVVITHEVTRKQMKKALNSIKNLQEVKGIAARMGCL